MLKYLPSGFITSNHGKILCIPWFVRCYPYNRDGTQRFYWAVEPSLRMPRTFCEFRVSIHNAGGKMRGYRRWTKHPCPSTTI